ncbi:MAG: hypothetical protein ABJD11_00780 [Gemmatimonadota bacterium]
MSRSILWFAVLLAACSGPRDVAVKVSIPGPDSLESPVANLPLVALPYNRDSVIERLEAAGKPRPNERRLDTLFAAYRMPFAEFASTEVRAQRLRDSLARTRTRLDSVPRGAPEYQVLYRRFGDATDSLAAVEQRRDKAQIALKRMRDTLAPRIDSLKSQVSRWEDSTYRGYDSIVGALSKARGLEPVADTTGPDGRASLRLKPGRWWIYSYSWDALDPNAEWYWNVEVKGDSVVLDRSSARRRRRY